MIHQQGLRRRAGECIIEHHERTKLSSHGMASKAGVQLEFNWSFQIVATTGRLVSRRTAPRLDCKHLTLLYDVVVDATLKSLNHGQCGGGWNEVLVLVRAGDR